MFSLEALPLHVGTALAAGYVLLQVADARLTLLVLAAGGRELNPLVRWAMQWHPQVGLLLAKVAAVALYVPVYRSWMAVLLFIFYTGVVANNYIQYRKGMP